HESAFLTADERLFHRPELANVNIGRTLELGLLLSQADTGDRWGAKYRAGHVRMAYPRRLTSKLGIGKCPAFRDCNRCQIHAVRHVTHRPNAGHTRTTFHIYRDRPSSVQLDAHRLQAQSLHIGPTTR